MNIFNKMMIFGLLIAGCANGMEMPPTLSVDAQESAQIDEKEIACKKEQDALRSIVIINEYPDGHPFIKEIYQFCAMSEEGRKLGDMRVDDFSDCSIVCAIEVEPAFRKHGIGKRLMCAIPYFMSTPKIELRSYDSARGFYTKLGLKPQGEDDFTWMPKEWKKQQESLHFERLDNDRVRVTIKNKHE